jgi:hypothetical protein
MAYLHSLSYNVAHRWHKFKCRSHETDEPRRDHLGVVEDEQVARPQQCREIRDPPVLKCGEREVLQI